MLVAAPPRAVKLAEENDWRELGRYLATFAPRALREIMPAIIATMRGRGVDVTAAICAILDAMPRHSPYSLIEQVQTVLESDESLLPISRSLLERAFFPPDPDSSPPWPALPPGPYFIHCFHCFNIHAYTVLLSPCCLYRLPCPPYCPFVAPPIIPLLSP